MKEAPQRMNLLNMSDEDIDMAVSNIPEGEIKYPLPNVKGGVVRFQVVFMLREIRKALLKGDKTYSWRENKCSPVTGEKVSELTGYNYYHILDQDYYITHNFRLS